MIQLLLSLIEEPLGISVSRVAGKLSSLPPSIRLSFFPLSRLPDVRNIGCLCLLTLPSSPPPLPPPGLGRSPSSVEELRSQRASIHLLYTMCLASERTIDVLQVGKEGGGKERREGNKRREEFPCVYLGVCTHPSSLLPSLPPSLLRRKAKPAWSPPSNKFSVSACTKRAT